MEVVEIFVKVLFGLLESQKNLIFALYFENSSEIQKKFITSNDEAELK